MPSYKHDYLVIFPFTFSGVLTEYEKENLCQYLVCYSREEEKDGNRFVQVNLMMYVIVLSIGFFYVYLEI